MQRILEKALGGLERNMFEGVVLQQIQGVPPGL